MVIKITEPNEGGTVFIDTNTFVVRPRTTMPDGGSIPPTIQSDYGSRELTNGGDIYVMDGTGKTIDHMRIF